MTQRRTPSVVIITLFVLCVIYPARPAHAAVLCYSETNQCIADSFTTYWQSNGGLSVFGFPATTIVPEGSADSERVYLTQWFERNRLELHPENAAPYGVLLGRLGEERLRQLGRDWRTFPTADPNAPHYFALTEHAIADEFWAYWSGHGLDVGDPGISERESLALFGYPLSEPATERNAVGDTVLTQWFERARFEYHPNNPQPYKVLLGLLGNETRPAMPPAQPFYENREGSPVEFLVSYYNTINRGEYERAYNYWGNHTGGLGGGPTDLASFAAGFAQTASVAVTFGTPEEQGAAGSVYATVPTAIIALNKDGSVDAFGGCYVVRRTNEGIDPDPNAVLWRLEKAAITQAPVSLGVPFLVQRRCASTVG